MGFPLFLKKVHQYRFGIDANEFLAKHPMEEIDIARMNAKAIVHHCEMANTLGVKPMYRQHHVCGIAGMNEVRDDTIRLLSHVDLPRFVLFI